MRIGLKKTKAIPIKQSQRYENKLDLITRDETMKLDTVELLRVSWSLPHMQQRELSKPNLAEAQRQKQMNCFFNHFNQSLGCSQDICHRLLPRRAFPFQRINPF